MDIHYVSVSVNRSAPSGAAAFIINLALGLTVSTVTDDSCGGGKG